MNTSTAPAWSQPADADNMAQITASDLEDLGNLFEFGDIDLNSIPNVDPSAFADQLQHPAAPHQHASHPGSPFGDLSAPSPLPTTSAHDFGAQEQFALGLDPQGHQQLQRPTQYLSRENSQGPTSHPYGHADSMYKSAVRQPYQSASHPHQFQYQPQQQYPPVQHVPPTPNSYEMHGETARFMQQQHQQLEQQQRAYTLRKDDATAYTPMVSPAGTPQFPVQPEYTTPGAYFSPLTSPMMYAQQQGQMQQQHGHALRGYYTNPNTAPSSAATSPIDPNADVEMLDDMSLPEPASRRAKRKTVPTARNATVNRVKQSPIQKPQKRKSTLSNLAAVGKGPSDLLKQAQKPATLHPNQYAANPSSEEGSISPEHLSESVMGPPPRPATGVAQSPIIRTPAGSESGSIAGAAATPKSILSMRGMGTGTSVMSEGGVSELGALEDLHLPEAAAVNNPRRASLNRINTNVSSVISSEESTPRLASRKTPKLGPDSTPSSSGRPGSARLNSAVASPSLAGSPMVTGSTPAGLLHERKGSKSSRSATKRGSIGGASVSPAIRPRISPSIKPLLPEGSSLHSPTHALLLASKSNYQNLLEGNHLPGVNYPDSLSTGLTSKRTSHKVAEQGRRNRINDALKEMQALLPKATTSSKSAKESANESSPSGDAGAEAESKDSKEDAAAKSNSSKAATVESANKYIRELQQENAEKTANLLLLQKEHAEMRKRLAAQQSGETSTNDEDENIDE